MTRKAKWKENYQSVEIIEQACHDCLLRVEAWVPFGNDDGFLDVQVISNGQASHQMHLKTRLKNAWKVLRGSYDWSGFEVYTKEEAESLVLALQDATKEAFPTIISETSVNLNVKK